MEWENVQRDVMVEFPPDAELDRIHVYNSFRCLEKGFSQTSHPLPLLTADRTRIPNHRRMQERFGG